MRYKIACVGRIKEDYLMQIIEEDRKAVNRHDELIICEVPDEQIPRKASDKVNARIINTEAQRLKNVIENDEYIIALCIEGRKTTIEDLRKQIVKAENLGMDTVTFVIGGSLGLDPEITRRANYKMSVSEMTFPHQLMRAALVEQIMLISGEMV